MKNRCCIFIVFLFLLSCQSGSKKKTVECVSIKELTKLEQLFLLPQDSIMVEYDLSNDCIVSFPDLSSYTIKTLNLSNNLLDTFIAAYLPKELEKLNLSHNRYRGILNIEEFIPDLQELDISYNKLRTIEVGKPLYRLILSHNDFGVILLNHKNLRYLDVSYNSRLTQEVSFEPTQIDTVVREGVAEGKRLYGPISIWSIKAIE
ncbi:putative adenylate cyclase [Bacteroides sp. 3_1_23]|uniref:hypothetical protein n=1 Tax=Bacteroides sp. 3_1_23 TaxID=457390 RepID=UPI0001DAA2DB|nr:hypothetical protein [Bacteroides sp. 3_1_23]EFI40265.1 putative adenylate cyclase [Bacteroides sp. 3_1_23]